MLQIPFWFIPVQKIVSEVLKTWYFFYSVLWSTDQCYSPPWLRNCSASRWFLYLSFINARAENPISHTVNMNLENGLQFFMLLHTILDIRLPNYELKIIKVLRALLCQ